MRLPTRDNLPKRYKLIVFASISLVTLFSTIYLLWKHCAIGAVWCPALNRGQQLAKSWEEIVGGKNDSERAILASLEELNSSIEILHNIAPWSRHGKMAEKLLQTYEARKLILELVLKSSQKTTQAVTLAENQPLNTEITTQMQQLWQEAIALLEQLPAHSQWYPQVKEKIALYQQESLANEILTAALQAASIAQVRQSLAQSPDNWQLVQSTWETAIKRLEEIPPNTTAKEQGKELQPIWTEKLAGVRAQKQQEQLALGAYEQAIRWAEQAENAAAQNQWSKAIADWNNALNSLASIPVQSIQYNRTLSQKENFTQQLAEAKARLQLALKQEQAKLNLEQICVTETKICDYKIEDNSVKVILSSHYMMEVWQIELQARVDGNIDIQKELRKHISSVENALQHIRQNSGIPLEVYSWDGSLLVTYP